MSNETKLTPTTEEQIELCNAINTAIGKGCTVKVSGFPIKGAFMKDEHIMILHASDAYYKLCWKDCVVVFHVTETEAATLYVPTPPKIAKKEVSAG